MSHTPGPWQHRTFTCDSGKPLQIIEAGANGWADDRYMNVSGVIDPDDARLIAAAPELLEALKDMAHWLKLHKTKRNTEEAMLMHIRDVLNKAQGEV